MKSKNRRPDTESLRQACQTPKNGKAQVNPGPPPGQDSANVGCRETVSTRIEANRLETTLTSGREPDSSPPPAEATVAPQPRSADPPFSAFASLEQFKDAQRMALLLARSSIVPESYRGDEHLGDCVLALEIANRIGASVLAVMQNLYVVQGKPGWSSQFLISCINASKRFSPIRYQTTGTRGEDSWGRVACAVDTNGELLKSPEVTLKMAKDEGWYFRPGSKWKTMPELMLCYRSATLFVRLYAPELTMGLQTTEEVVDMGAQGNGPVTRPIFTGAPCPPKPKPASESPNGNMVPPAAKTRLIFPSQADSPTAATHVGEPLPDTMPEGMARVSHYNYLKALTGLIRLSRHSEAEVLRFLQGSRRCAASLSSLAAVAEKEPDALHWIHDNWPAVDRELKHLKEGQAP